MTTQQPNNRDQAESLALRLRSDAYLAYLDGRVKRARELNKKADLMLRAFPAGRAALRRDGISTVI